jgi:short-subunit dehydrogenase
LVRFQPSGAIAVVTGASSGIGRELCRLLFQAGASVVATARREDRLIRLGEELSTASFHATAAPATYRYVAGDVTDPAVREKVLGVASELGQGRLDLLVNNAGIGAIGPFESASEERLRRIMEVNFFAPAELVRAALPMLHRGRTAVICNIGSVLGHRGVPDKSEYCASKFALHGWSDSLRAELHPSGIAVTLVSPSTTSSEFFDAVIDTDAGTVSSSIGSWKPDRVARATFAAILSRRAEVILSLGGKTLVYADRIAPPLVNWAVAKRGTPFKP